MPNDKITSNKEIVLDLFWLDGKMCLHVEDIESGYSNAAFLRWDSLKQVCTTLITI